MDMGRGKDHMASVKGDMMHVLLINHPKLPEGRYLVEKEDGTSEGGGAGNILHMFLYLCYNIMGRKMLNFQESCVALVFTCLFFAFLLSQLVMLTRASLSG